MIGLMAKPVTHPYVASTREEGWDDTLVEGKKLVRQIEGFEGMEQVVMRFEQVGNSTMAPIHRQILDAEQLTLAKMRRLLCVHCGLAPRCLREL